MDAGLQNGLHNEQGGFSRPRSAASVDLSMNFGSNGPTDGKFVLDINDHLLTLAHVGSGATAQWYFKDGAGTPVQGLTLSPDGHTLQDSMNLAFVSQYLQHGTNPADLLHQDVHISLIEMSDQFQPEPHGWCRPGKRTHPPGLSATDLTRLGARIRPGSFRFRTCGAGTMEAIKETGTFPDEVAPARPSLFPSMVLAAGLRLLKSWKVFTLSSPQIGCGE